MARTGSIPSAITLVTAKTRIRRKVSMNVVSGMVWGRYGKEEVWKRRGV